MRLEQLEYFIELSKHSSLAKASEHLFISPQSLGKSIKELENEMHVQLLNRTNKGISLTPEGWAVIESAKNILEQIRQLKNKYCTEDSSFLFSGTLKVLGCSVVYLTIMQEAIRLFQEDYPAMKVMSMEQESYAIPQIQAELLRASPKIPVLGIINKPNFLMFDEFIAPEKDLVFHPLAKTRFVAFVNQNFPLAQSKKVSLKSLLNYPAIIFSPSYAYNNIDTLILEQYGVPKTDIIVDSMPLLAQSLEKSGGFSLLPVIYKDIEPIKHLSNITYIEIKESTASVIGCTYTASSSSYPFVQCFIEILENLSTIYR